MTNQELAATSKEFISEIKSIFSRIDLHAFNYKYDRDNISCQISYGISLRTLNDIQQKISDYTVSIYSVNNNIELVFKRKVNK